VTCEVDAPCPAWGDRWVQVPGHDVVVHSATRPTVGVTADTPDRLVAFVRDLGYIVEPASPEHALVLDHSDWSPAIRWLIARHLANSHAPLVRLNRWPGNHRSALCITGDLDSLTWWDYARRFVEA